MSAPIRFMSGARNYNPADLRIDGERLWQALMAMARIGATPAGGVKRLALTDEDRAGRALLIDWARAAGCAVSVDAIGNVFLRRPGRDNGLAPVLTGSHLDSQPSGGKFDGAYGVIAGLEVLRCLADAGVVTECAIELVCWTNEEGTRFSPAMMGSGVFAGKIPLVQALAEPDSARTTTLAAELERIGYAGAGAVGGRPIHAYFEAHIEQGPILEAAGKTIGVVQGIQGIRWFTAHIRGADAHAGTTPMTARRDALLAAARLIEAINRIALDHAPGGRGTVGRLVVSPNSPNVVPGSVALSVDLRHPDAIALASMAGEVEATFDGLIAAAGLDGSIEQTWYSPPTAFDPACIEAVRRGAEAIAASSMAITSGAGHDAKYLADICPAAMVFVPCKGGVSHNESEDARPEHLAAGCQVLLHAIMAKADEPD